MTRQLSVIGGRLPQAALRRCVRGHDGGHGGRGTRHRFSHCEEQQWSGELAGQAMLPSAEGLTCRSPRSGGLAVGIDALVGGRPDKLQ